MAQYITPFSWRPGNLQDESFQCLLEDQRKKSVAHLRTPEEHIEYTFSTAQSFDVPGNGSLDLECRDPKLYIFNGHERYISSGKDVYLLLQEAISMINQTDLFYRKTDVGPYTIKLSIMGIETLVL